MKTVCIDQVQVDDWNTWSTSLSDASLVHTHQMIRYYDACNVTGMQNRSFAAFDDTGQLIAICPFAVHESTSEGRTFKEASFSGAPLGMPAVASFEANERRRQARKIYEHIDTLCREESVSRILFRRPSVTVHTAEDPRPIGMLDPLAAGYVCHVRAGMWADLRLNEDVLKARMSKELRKRVRKSVKVGLRVASFGGLSSSPEAAARMFEFYRRTHQEKAGITRPDKSWLLMKSYLLEGGATLFVSFAGETPVSFLYCFEFGGIAMGGSQVNVPAFEQEYSPRHHLEWEAMLHYRHRDFSFYEIGPRFKHPSHMDFPTEKEVTISDMKERYGGDVWPEFVFEKYLDPALESSVLRSRLNRRLPS